MVDFNWSVDVVCAARTSSFEFYSNHEILSAGYLMFYSYFL